MTSIPGVRLDKSDYDWLMENRGAGTVASKVHELILYFCYPQGNGASENKEKVE